jgi:hypothetical protein
VEQVEFITLEEHLNQVQDLVGPRTPGFGGGGHSGTGGVPNTSTAGGTNTGGGGGGIDAGAPYSGNGGSGVVIIRYKYQ